MHSFYHEKIERTTHQMPKYVGYLLVVLRSHINKPLFGLVINPRLNQLRSVYTTIIQDKTKLFNCVLNTSRSNTQIPLLQFTFGQLLQVSANFRLLHLVTTAILKCLNMASESDHPKIVF